MRSITLQNGYIRHFASSPLVAPPTGLREQVSLQITKPLIVKPVKHSQQPNLVDASHQHARFTDNRTVSLFNRDQQAYHQIQCPINPGVHLWVREALSVRTVEDSTDRVVDYFYNSARDGTLIERLPPSEMEFTDARYLVTATGLSCCPLSYLDAEDKRKSIYTDTEIPGPSDVTRFNRAFFEDYPTFQGYNDPWVFVIHIDRRVYFTPPEARTIPRAR